MTLRGLWLAAAYLLAAIFAGSLLAWMLAPLLPVSYDKVLSRGVLLFCGLGLVPLWRYAGLHADTVGLKPVAPGQALRACLPGILLVLPPMLFFLVVRYRVFDDRVVFLSAEFIGFFLAGIGSAVLVGLFEETLFRGVLFAALRRRSGFLASATVVSLLYAAVHFLNRADAGNVTEVYWYTGLQLVTQVFGSLGAELSWDSFASLFLLGVLLCWVREHLGLWACIGLHAAWVFAIRLFKEITVRDVVSPYAATVGTYDNFVGHAVSVWLIFLFVLIALWRQHQRNLG